MMKALKGDKPHSAVTQLIDTLCSDRFAEEDVDGVPELVTAINLQGTGPTEAARALRKKLKYGSIHNQFRALTLMGFLVENGNNRFRSTFLDPMLEERILMVAQDEMVDARVRRRLSRMLAQWARELKDDPYSTSLVGLYRRAGGGQRAAAAQREAQREAQRDRAAKQAESLRREKEMERVRAAQAKQAKADYKVAQKAQANEQRQARTRTTFNLEQEKPTIMSCISQAQQYSTALVNALQLVNREQESVRSNAKVQQYLLKVKVERKRVVRYIQLVQDEEFIGTLIATNEQIILALELYDKLSKSAENDSDEETSVLGQLRGQEAVDAQIREQDAEIEAVRQRLLRARFEPEGEIAQLQERQRRGIERHNSYFSSAPGPAQRDARRSGGAMADLMDLNFDAEDAPSTRPLEPRRYGSPDSLHSDDSAEAEVAMASASRSRRFEASDDDTDSIYYTRRPQIGPRYASSFVSDGERSPSPAARGGSSRAQEQDDDFDPFADPEDAVPQARPARSFA